MPKSWILNFDFGQKWFRFRMLGVLQWAPELFVREIEKIEKE